MPKKRYVLRTVVDGYAGYSDDYTTSRPFERNLLDLSGVGIKWNTSLIKSSRTSGIDDQVNSFGMFPTPGIDTDPFSEIATFSGQNDYIAKSDQSYVARRDFLRKFALQNEVEYVVETVANSVIVKDEYGYFAYPDTKNLKARLRAQNAKQIVDDINYAYRRVYNAWRFTEGDDAWQWVKKFLVDGFLCFEIIYNTDSSDNEAREIIGFKEIDATIIRPKLKYDRDGNECKFWIVNEGNREKERELPDSNVIYISWAKNNFISRTSYIEKLLRPFNILRTIENSHTIWNIQNAQKRINVTVPSELSEQRGRTKMGQIMAYFKEDISIDDTSGELLVNGQPKFQFYKTFFTPSKNGNKIEISEIATEGHNMNTTESLKYFWQRFMLSTELPKDRFSMMFDGQSGPAINDRASMTKEEHKFNLFIKRIRDIIQELLIKPTWIQFCLKYPNFSTNDILRSSFGLAFVEENIFEREKERAMLESGAATIQTLSQIKQADGRTPVFSSRYLFEKFLLLSEDEWKINKKYLEEETKENKSNQDSSGQNTFPGMDMGGGMDMGLGGDPGMDMGGGFTEPQGFDTTGSATVGDNFASGGEIPM